MGDKYRQIYHFVELLAPALRSLTNREEIRVVDMGSGKGYLTFAIYAFLKQEGFKVEVAGIERRRPLVDLCNSVAGQCEFGDLRFEVGEISTARLDGVDMVVAGLRSLSPWNIPRKTFSSSLQRTQNPLTMTCGFAKPQRSKNSSASRVSAWAISCVPSKRGFASYPCWFAQEFSFDAMLSFRHPARFGPDSLAESFLLPRSVPE
jgi:hypothetical protein